MKKLVTHSGSFHTDDVLAYSILSLYFKKTGEEFQLTRTRDQAIIDTADIVFDIGAEYDPTRNRYDHHQIVKAGNRENGIPYAACGLVWKHFGKELCSTADMWQSIDETLVQPIDAHDNGFSITTPLIPGIYEFGIGKALDAFRPVGENPAAEEYLSGFLKASELMTFILSRMILDGEEYEQNKKTIISIYEKTKDKSILVFDRDYSRSVFKILSDFPDTAYVVHPDSNNNWRVSGIRTGGTSLFEIKKDLPKEWSGLRDEEFQKVSGVATAYFCHPNLFTCGATTFEGAMELAKKALLM